ncbi:hypothetical protein ADN01_10215 [Levilinea saccharolytica]|uniref:Uncharacterized protein n=1 Tax=Levilinea saccharolytica TaxID=229921 RepID=A0A0N8GPS1_9CHLR|nr:hypothetical protein ADN01_10215 [Levilinea saccharolytica]
MRPVENPAYQHVGAGAARDSNGMVYYVLHAAYSSGGGGSAVGWAGEGCAGAAAVSAGAGAGVSAAAGAVCVGTPAACEGVAAQAARLNSNPSPAAPIPHRMCAKDLIIGRT